MADIDIHALLIALVGGAVTLAALASVFFRKLGLSVLVAYMFIGFALRLIDNRWPLLSPAVLRGLDLLADLGLVALLFHTGLNSNLMGLLNKLPTASLVWIGNMLLAAVAGYLAARYWLDLALIPALAIATALTATSLGVSVSPWQEVEKLDSEPGQLLIDVAELDDISGIALMAVLFAVLPVLQDGTGNLWMAGGQAAGLFIVKFLVFVGFCYLFAHFAEGRISAFCQRLEPPPERMATTVGIGLLIAALAGWLGFSLAIGALFAGLAFSRDPEAVKADDAFRYLYVFFTPFFFIGIGLAIDPQALLSSVYLSGTLLLVAVVGKVVGAGLPARLFMDNQGALLIGLSMVPRAEIAMVIIAQAHQVGAVDEVLYAAMVVVSASTCLIAPLALRPLLNQWQPPQARST